ncbi:GIP [Symbiodinium sp. CCMP2592]|nr:GIP [Symbiodinium sp. CCMP2592]
MASYTESEPVFTNRCETVGLGSEAVTKLKAAGINTLAKVAFVSSYAPGAASDAELIKVLNEALGKESDAGQKASWRRLFHEAYAVATQELKTMAERPDEAGPRRLSQPERAERYRKIKASVSGIDIKDRNEPSDALLDLCVGIYEGNRLRYVSWDRCTSKSQELSSEVKRDNMLTVDSQGRLKAEAKGDHIKADTSSEILLQFALLRRGLAFEMSNLLDFRLHRRWAEKLIETRMAAQLDTHSQVSFAQLEAADQKFFQELADRTRDGVQATAVGRPLDDCFEEVFNLPEVTHVMQPLPKPSGRVEPPPKPRWSPYDRPSKGGRKGKSPGTGKSTPRMPKELVGCKACTNRGDPICFGYGLKTCSEQVGRDEVAEMPSAMSSGQLGVGLSKRARSRDRAIAQVADSAEGSDSESSIFAAEQVASAPLFCKDPEQFSAAASLKKPLDLRDVVTLCDLLESEIPARGNNSEDEFSWSTGAYVHGGVHGCRQHMHQFPVTSTFLAKVFKEYHPRLPVTTLSLTRNVRTTLHLDANNALGYLNGLVKISGFSGGGLWVQDSSGSIVCPTDPSLLGSHLDFSDLTLAFDPHKKHLTLPWTQGPRIVLIGFVVKAPAEIPDQAAEMLLRAGFNLPCQDTATSLCQLGSHSTFSGLSSSSLVPKAKSSRGAPLVIQLCAGSGLLSASVKAANIDTLAVDFHGNRTKPYVHVVGLDLTLPASWEYLTTVLENRHVVHVHVTPPSGTTRRSRAKSSLRSASHPWGVPGQDSSALARLQSANRIFIQLGAFLLRARELEVPFSLMHPMSSWLWELPPFADLLKVTSEAPVYLVSDLHRIQHLRLVYTLCDLSPLSAADRADAVPAKLFCDRFAAALSTQVAALGLGPSPLSLPEVRAAAQNQPKASKLPPLVPEFAYTQRLRCAGHPPLDAKNQLTHSWNGVPKHARLLRSSASEGGATEESAQQATNISLQKPRHTEYVFGVYREPVQFVYQAVALQHPFDAARALPDKLVRVLFDTLTKGPLCIMRNRLLLLQKWNQWAKDLRSDEAALQASLHPSVRKVLQGKKLLLLDKIAKSLDWPDKHLHRDLCAGFKLSGVPDPTGVFEPDHKPALSSEEQFWDAAEVLKHQLWARVREQPAQEYDAELAEITLGETGVSGGKGWLEGPLSFSELQERFEGQWMPCRRFAVWQNKWRPIDDLSESGLNATFGCHEKIPLRALDEVVWICTKIMQAASARGDVTLHLSSGETLKGKLHDHWTDKEKIRPVTTTFDLKSAYKQLPLAPEEQSKAIVTIRHPSQTEPSGYICNTLPFGACGSVLHFNRVSALLRRIMLEMEILTALYYDDYPVVTPSLLGNSTAAAFTSVMSQAIAAAIEEIITRGHVAPRELPSLFGRLQFAEAQVLGRMGRLAIHDLRSLERCSAARVNLTAQHLEALLLLKERVVSGAPRTVSASAATSPIVIFTDGCFEPDAANPAGVGGVMFAPSLSGGLKVRAFGSLVPKTLLEAWHAKGKRHLIGQVEMFAVIIARSCWANVLDGARVIYFVDHSGVLAACISGSSKEDTWRKLLCALEKADSLPALQWFSRVPSHSNISDGPSRGRWEGLLRAFPECAIDVKRGERSALEAKCFFLVAVYRVIGNMTAYERACGAKYSGRIAPFAEPVYCQLDVKQKGDKRWMLGILVSKSSLNDMYIIAGKDGIRLSRSIRRVGQPWELEVQLYRELKGYPWDYGSGVIGTKFVAMPKQRHPAVDPVRDVAPPRSPDEAASEPPTPAVEALGMPVTPLGGAGAMAPPRRNVPDPPSTPEAELPPLKKLRIRAVTFGEQSYEVNDEGEFDLDQPDGWEVQTKLWSMESETDDSFMNEVKANPEAEVAEDDDRLWFPDNGREPELDDAILAELDNLADQVEVSRLLKKSVLRHATSDDDLGSMKSLTTKFVRTWRHKKRNGVPSWYRRSRLCAREFRWLDESKEGLFSPATSTDIVRLIPAQWLNWKQSRPSEQYAILALDVKDAYLEVPQPTPVVSKVQGQDLVFMRMVPGQREGSQQWFSHFCEYLGEHFVIEKCKECPAVVHVSSKPGSDGGCADKGPGMIHVDDSLLLLPLQWARECFLPVIEQRFQITYELAYEVGHSFSFLKREHTITEQGIVIRQPSSYIEQMKQTMNVTQNNRQRVPCWSELRAKDTTRELNHTDASKFRQAVGTALYISCDRPDVGYAVRMLASYMARPTEHAKVGLIKLIQYLINTCDYGILMKFAAPGTRKLNGYVYDSGCADDAERNVLEVFSDADWSGSKKDRRSYGGASFCVNGQYVHYICRSQKCISLSSMESEYYSAVGSACQGLFMKAVIEFMSRSPCDLILYVDNQSCKAFCLRQGVTKASKHFEGRLLWLQDIVQQKRLVMKYISTHFNLGDLHTKPLSPSRLRTLLFLHDFVDCHSRPIGENEWEHTCTAATIRAQVKRVRTVAGNDMSNTWVKRVAMLLLMMPIPAEASAVTSVNMSACFFLAVLVSMYMAVYAMESTAEHGANGGDEGWLYIAAPGGPWYRRGAMYAACVMMATIAWSLGSISVGFFRDVEIVRELGALCSALWDEQKDDKRAYMYQSILVWAFHESESPCIQTGRKLAMNFHFRCTQADQVLVHSTGSGSALAQSGDPGVSALWASLLQGLEHMCHVQVLQAVEALEAGQYILEDTFPWFAAELAVEAGDDVPWHVAASAIRDVIANLKSNADGKKLLLVSSNVTKWRKSLATFLAGIRPDLWLVQETHIKEEQGDLLATHVGAFGYQAFSLPGHPTGGGGNSGGLAIVFKKHLDVRKSHHFLHQGVGFQSVVLRIRGVDIFLVNVYLKTGEGFRGPTNAIILSNLIPFLRSLQGEFLVAGDFNEDISVLVTTSLAQEARGQWVHTGASTCTGGGNIDFGLVSKGLALGVSVRADWITPFAPHAALHWCIDRRQCELRFPQLVGFKPMPIMPQPFEPPFAGCSGPQPDLESACAGHWGGSIPEPALTHTFEQLSSSVESSVYGCTQGRGCLPKFRRDKLLRHTSPVGAWGGAQASFWKRVLVWLELSAKRSCPAPFGHTFWSQLELMWHGSTAELSVFQVQLDAVLKGATPSAFPELIQVSEQQFRHHSKLWMQKQSASYGKWLKQASCKGLRGLFTSVKADEAVQLRPFLHQPVQERIYLRWRQWFELWSAPGGVDPALLSDLRQRARMQAKELGPIPLDQAVAAFKRVPSKAPGLDGWTFEMLKNLQRPAVASIISFLHHCETEATWPAQMVFALIALLPKSEKRERPIALLHVLYRTWVRMRWKLVSDWQFQYCKAAVWDKAMPGSQVLDVALGRLLRGEAARQSGQHLVTIFIDMETFYDRCRFNDVISSGLSLGYPPLVLHQALLTYMGPRFLQSEGSLCPAITPTKGVLAGCPAAPSISKLVVHPIAVAATSKRATSNLDVWIDDLSLDCVGASAKQIASDAVLLFRSLRTSIEATGQWQGV